MIGSDNLKVIKLNVNENSVTIDSSSYIINKGEYNVTNCEFSFTEQFTDLTKVAVFSTAKTEKPIIVDIIENKCYIPYEVLGEPFDYIKIGVYGYATDSEDNLSLRYSPSPVDILVSDGSYTSDVTTPEITTPSQYEIFSEKLQEGLATVDESLDMVTQNSEYAKEQGDYAKQQGDYVADKITEIDTAIKKVEELKKAVDEILETNNKYSYLILEKESE